MFRDHLVEKAWEMRHQAECFPVGTILKAAVWLEEKHQQAPHWETAIAIALQYLMLAMRRDSQASPGIAKEYFSRAMRWREEARGILNKRSLLIGHQSQN
ncbi:MAG: hypothetical protein ACE5JU_22835 [Candidatus Binatia bacterium]